MKMKRKTSPGSVLVIWLSGSCVWVAEKDTMKGEGYGIQCGDGSNGGVVKTHKESGNPEGKGVGHGI